MKILALTDIHGAYKRAAEIISETPSDVVIIGGDLTTVGSVKEAETAILQLQSAGGGRLLAVAGNMDLPQHDQMLDRLGVSLNGKGVIVGDVGFFGVSSAPLSPLRTPYEITEEEIGKRIQAGFSQVKECRTTVFVPHAPPYGSKVDITHSGLHVGSTAVRDFIEEAQPSVVVCGHIHEARGQDLLDGSRIVNCGPASAGYYATILIGEMITVENHQQR